MKRIKEAAAEIVKKAVFTVYLFTMIAPGGAYGQGRTEGARGVKREASAVVAQKVIGQEGGVLEAEGVRFSIPEGAVEAEVEITISRLYEVAESGEVKNVTAGFGGYRFLPKGMKFKRACELSLEYDERIEGEDAQGIYTYYYDEKEKRWVALERKRVDEEGKRIESYTDHFTDMINGTLSLPESPEPVRVNLNSIKELKAADAAGGIEGIEGLKGGSEGSASFGIKLKVPEGVKGMAPELSVSYSSGSGWGLIGKGWSLGGIESVSIDTRFGLPEYNGKDTYIVEGSRVRYEGGEWRKEKEQKYERIENAWVERRGGAEANYFKITEKDGREKEYGKERWSGKGAGAKYIYYLDRERDRFGNEVKYVYKKESGADGEEVVLEEIVYGKEGERKVRLEYEGRGDVRLEGRGKYVRKESKRLSSIEMSVGGRVVRKYGFEYRENEMGESLLVKLLVKGEGSSEGYGYEFGYEQAETDERGRLKVFGETEGWYTGEGLSGKSNGGIQVSSGYAMGSNYAYSTGIGIGPASGEFDIRTTRGSGAGLVEGEQAIEQQVYVDIDGDGRADAISRGEKGLSVMRNNGHGFDKAEIWEVDISGIEKEENQTVSTSINRFLGAGGGGGVTYGYTRQNSYHHLKTSFADMDGDGRADIVVSGKNYYLKNSGEGFKAVELKGLEKIKVPKVELSEEQKKEYDNSFYQQNPFRQWKSRYGGTIKIESIAEMDEGNKDKREVVLRVYKGEKKESEESISEEKRVSVGEKKFEIKGGESLYFVPYAACNEGGQRIRWKIKIRYEQLEPFNDMEGRISWRLDKGSGKREGALKSIREQDSDGSVKIRKDWFEIVSRGANEQGGDERRAAEYLIRRGKFIPIIIDKEGMDSILQAAGYEHEGKQNEIKELISRLYIYEIVNERYVLFDEQMKKHKVYESERELSEAEKELMQVMAALNDDQIREVLKYRNKYITGENAKRLFLDGCFCEGKEWARSRIEREREIGVNKIGYVDEKGRIYLDRLNGKYVTALGKEIYLGEEKIGEGQIEEGYRKKKIVFKMKGDGSQIEYEAGVYEPKGFKLGTDEIERIVIFRGKSGEYREEHERWSILGETEYERLIRVAGREEEGRVFIEGVYRKDKGQYYLRRQDIGSKEKERLNKLLKEYEKEEFAEGEGYRYNERTREYELADSEYLHLVSEGKLEELSEVEREQEKRRYEKLKEGARNSFVGRYGRIKRVMKYKAHDRYSVLAKSGQDFIRIYLIEGDSLTHIDVVLDRWDSGEDYSNEDIGKDVLSYEAESEREVVKGMEEKDGEFTKIIEKVKVKSRMSTAVREILSGGTKQWFYGIWIKDQNREEYAFSEKKLTPNIKKINQRELKREIEEKNSNKEKTMEDMTDGESLSYYVMTANNKKNKEKYTVIRKEAESGTELDEQYYVGNINEWITEDKTELYTYTPFLYQDSIYSNRVGGSKYYRIPGIEQSEMKGFPSIKGSSSSSTEHAFASLLNFEKDESLESIPADKFMETFFSKAAHVVEKVIRRLLSNISYAKSEGLSSTSIMVTDMDGNGTADIVMSEADRVIVHLNKENQFGEGYAITNLYNLAETKDCVDTFGSGLSRSGSVSKDYDSKHRLLMVRPSFGVAISKGISISRGESNDTQSFIDINGDGLPDSMRTDGAYINTGDSVTRIAGLSCALEKRETYTLASSVNMGGDLCTEIEMQQVSANVSGAIGYSGAYNKIIRRFVNIRGTLIDSITMKKDEAELTVNTGNRFSEKKVRVALPAWDISAKNKANLFFVMDGNVFFTFFSHIPGLGKVLSKKQTSAFARDGLSLNPLSAALLAKINTIGISSSVALSANVGGGVSATVSIPIETVRINIPFNGGKGINIMGNVNGVAVSMQDIDGDGLADRILRIPGRTGAVYVQRNKLGKVGLLKTIHLPTGGSYEIEYQRVGNTQELPQSKYVLSSVTMNSGLQTKSGNVQSYKTQYTYKDGYYDRKAKEFYGFKTVRAVTGTGKTTETEYYIDAYYRKGMVKKETVSAQGNIYSIKEYETDEVPHARVKREWNTIREGYRSIQTESDYRYDRYGNVTSLEDKGDVTNPNDDIIARIRYWDSGDERRYFKAHPERIEVLDGKSGRLLRKREGRYDSQTGAITEIKQYTSSGTNLTYTIDWDESGNIKTMISPTGKKVRYRYQDGIYVNKITEEGSTGGVPYESTLLWDSALGVKLEETDSAKSTMKYRYDGFGRVIEVRSPYDDPAGTPYAKYEYHTPSSSFWYTVTANKLTTEAADTAIMKTIVMHDGLGRALYTAKEGEVYREGTAGETNVGWNISGATHYDEAGRKIKEGMPFFYGGDLPNELANKAAYASVEQFYELNDFTALRNETAYTYDGIDRVINTLLPDGSEQKNEYEIEDGLQVTKATDPLENKSVTKKDARGNIREVERRDKANNILTKGRYEYSVLGEMLRAYDAHENIVSVTYDLLGRRIALESKDTGRKEWRYDSKGLLEAETDSLLRSKLSEIQYHYDGFDRLIKIDYPFSEDVMYEYGVPGQAGAGEIVHKKDESGEIRYEYGRLSEVVKETRTIKRYEALSEPETATFTYRSDYLGRMQTMRYPDGETIIYTYDKGGQLKGVSGVKNTVKGTENYSYIDTIVYDEHGQRVYIKYGNGVETKYRYDDKRRWLKDIETRNKQTDEVFQKISYRFDKVGNVLGYANEASVYETSQSYTYDSLYQLIGVEGTSNQYKAIKSFGSTPVHVAKYKQDFAFDGIGNMTKKSSTTNLPGARGNAYPNAELDYSLDYEYDPAYAHRLIHAGNRYYRYDANGNITAEKDGPFTEDEEFVFTYNYDPDTDVYGTDYGFGLDAPKETEETHPENLFAYRRNYTWNEKNQLTKSSDRSYTVHYRYGEDGQRALKYTEEGRSETLYFNNFYTIHIPVQDKNNPQGLRVHKHIFVGNSRLVTAMTHTDNNGDNAEQREKRYYYHSDHLGSAQFVTDWRGKQYEHIEYTPYGELWIEEVAAGLDKLPFRFTGKEMDEETGLYYYGARYLDPKYSRWLSSDPALGDYIPTAPVDDEAKKHNEKLPGMGGVFNVVNLHLYHYAGNNPVKYEDPDGKVSTETEVTLRIDGTLGKTNARDMAVTLYQYSKNPNEGALSSIVTSAVGFLGSKPGIVSALVSLVLASSSDEKNKINDFAFSIMNAVSDYGELLDSGDCSIHVTGDITTNNTIEFFRRKDEVLSKSTILASNLNFALVDKNGKEIKHLGKYTADPSVIQKLLDNYSEKPIKVIEFYNGVPIKIKRFE